MFMSSSAIWGGMWYQLELIFLVENAAVAEWFRPKSVWLAVPLFSMMISRYLYWEDYDAEFESQQVD